MTRSMIEPLIQVLNQLHPLEDAVIDFLAKNTTELNCRKGRMLLKEGAICEHLYFIRKGAIRGFMLDGQKDIGTWITAENEIVTSISALNNRAPSIENIQVIEHSQLIVIGVEKLEELYQTFPEFNIVGRKLLQIYYQDAEARAFISRIPGAEQRYIFFLKKYPHLVNRIPIKYIASFLGITLETLSRVRKKIAS